MAIVVACGAYLYSTGDLHAELVPGFIAGFLGAGEVIRHGLKEKRRL